MLVRELFDGSNRKMATFINCSHSAINAVVAGNRAPGFDFLATLASHERVNPDWLLTGRGVPFADQVPSAWRLPVTAQMLPGPVGDHGDMLSQATFPVPQEFCFDSRYWLEVHRAGDPGVDTQGWLLPGDLLLIESERSRFPAFDTEGGSLCVVALPGKSPPLQFAHIEIHRSWDEDGQLEEEYAECRPLLTEAGPVIQEYAVRRTPRGKLIPLQRFFQHTGRGEKEVKPLSRGIMLDNSDQVVGVCVLLVRRDLSHAEP